MIYADEDRKVGPFARYAASMRRNPGKPVHQWPVLGPLMTALVLTYASYFTYGVFLADTASRGEFGGVLVLESCEPNWTVLGTRSECVGTATHDGEPVLPSDREPYKEPFSHFTNADVGKPVPMQHEYAPPWSNDWKPLEPRPAPVLAEVLIGPLAIAAISTWFFALSRIVARGGALLINAFRRRG